MKKGLILGILIGLLVITTTTILVAIGIAAIRYQHINQQIDLLHAWNTAHAGFSKVVYKMKTSEFSDETLLVAGTNVIIDITPNAANATHNARITATHGRVSVELSVDFDGNRRVNYEISSNQSF